MPPEYAPEAAVRATASVARSICGFWSASSPYQIDLLALPLVLQDLLHRRQEFVAAQSREGQRPPGDPQLDAERRLVGAVAADVADHGVDGAVGRTDHVVEVAAEQGARAAGPVVGREPQVGALQEGGREQSALQAGVLLGAEPGLGEFDLDRVGPLALDRVPDGPAEQPSVEFLAEEVVLGPDAYGLGRQFRVGGGREGQDGVARGEAQDVPQRGERVVAGGGPGAGQGQVDEDAVDVVGEEPLGFGEVAGGADADPGAGGVRRVEQFGYGEGTRRVVLDDQEGEIGAVGACDCACHSGGVHGGGVRCGGVAGSRIGRDVSLTR